jgi:hypothetical protein
VEAVQAMTPEMRQRKVVLGPIFVQPVCAPAWARGPPASATPCSSAFAALAPPPTSESEAEAGYEYDTGPDLPTCAQATHCGRRPTSGGQRL